MGWQQQRKVRARKAMQGKVKVEFRGLVATGHARGVAEVLQRVGVPRCLYEAGNDGLTWWYAEHSQVGDAAMNTRLEQYTAQDGLEIQ